MSKYNYKLYIFKLFVYLTAFIKTDVLSKEIIHEIIVFIGSLTLFNFLIRASIEDIKTMMISSNIWIYGSLTGIAFNSIMNIYKNKHIGIQLIYDKLLSSIIIYLLMVILGLIGKKIFRKETLGIGDSKLAAMGGIWLGFEGITSAMALSFLLGGASSLIGRIRGQLGPLQEFPFAPYISTSIWFTWTFGSSGWVEKFQGLFFI